jgi:cyclopropane fatty-acyl-phospholipid synthase-like methyltransferase
VPGARRPDALALEPAELLREYAGLLQDLPEGPLLDLAGGECRNGLYAARLTGRPVVCCDASGEALERAESLAREQGLDVGPGSHAVRLHRKDMERDGDPAPLPKGPFAAILVFRYLHRPLFPHIRAAVAPGGLVFYETFTEDQPAHGKPHNPDFLLRRGELPQHFPGFEVIHAFEGVLPDPERAVARLVCRRPAALRGPAAQSPVYR